MATLKWRNEFIVNTTQPGNQDQSNLTALVDGGFVIAWRDDGLADSIIRWQRFDAQGLKVGDEFNDSTSFVADQSSPSIVQLSDGNLWIAQQDFDGATNRDGEGAVYSPETGARIAGRLPVVSGNDEVEVRVASLGAGGSVAVWTDLTANGGDIRMHGFNVLGGNSFGSGVAGVAVNTAAAALASAQGAPDVAASKDGQRFAVVWRDDGFTTGDIRARVYDAAGAAVSLEFTVNAATASVQSSPVVAWISNTAFVTAWVSFDELSGDGSSASIKYVVRTTLGARVGAERLANATGHDAQTDPAITALKDGGFAIAWVDSSNTGPDSSQAIRLQAFDGAGDKRGGEIVVNTTTNSSQFEPSLTTLADGRILVSWTDFSTFAAGNGASVRAQIVDPRDGVVDGTGQADTLFGHDSVGDVMSGYEGNDVMHGLKGNDTFYGAEGDDKAFGGAGDDVFFGGAGGDTFEGGAGEDEIDGEDGSDMAAYGTAKARIKLALDGSFAAEGDAAQDTLISIERVTGTDFGDVLRGDANSNRLLGGSANDTLQGMDANDVLTGGTGADAMTGGLANDFFDYTALNHGGDTIQDFANAAGDNDTIRFTGAVFGGLAAGALAANRFAANTTGLAITADQRFIYETDTGILRFDLNGTGTGGVTLIATLAGAPTLAAADIVIV